MDKYEYNLKLDQMKRKKYEEMFLGKTVEILVEERVTKDGKSVQVGHTKEYVKIAVDEEKDLQNQIINVKIENHLQIIH